MAVITLPAINANSMSLQLVRADVPLKFIGGGEVIVASPEAIWSISMQLASQTPEDNGRAWFAVLTQMSNLENTAKVTPVGIEIGSGYTGANPLVNGPGQLGITLNVDGATATTTIGLQGDPFEVNGEFKILTQDALTTGGGAVTLNFEPALRSPPANNATVDIKTPQLTTRLVAPIANLDVLLGQFYDMTVTFIESFRP